MLLKFSLKIDVKNIQSWNLKSVSVSEEADRKDFLCFGLEKLLPESIGMGKTYTLVFFPKNIHLLNMSDQASEKKIPHIICPDSVGAEFDCQIGFFLVATTDSLMVK